MKSNESSIDRIIRVVLGIALLAISWNMGFAGVGAILLLAVGVIALLTGVVGFCPLYGLLKFRTNKA
jgi:hypothetical protein